MTDDTTAPAFAAERFHCNVCGRYWTGVDTWTCHATGCSASPKNYAALLRIHGRSDELDALLADKKIPFPQREAIEAIQELCMKAASEIERLQSAARAVLAEPPKEVAALIDALWSEWAKFSTRDRDVIHLAKLLKQAALALARLSAPVPDTDVAQDDLRDILRAVGLSDCARPYSPHEVVQRELLPHLRSLRNVIEKYDGNSNNPYWAEEFNQAVRIARAHLDAPHAATPVPAREWTEPKPNHAFVGGYEIDPSQPSICQVCGKPHGETTK